MPFPQNASKVDTIKNHKVFGGVYFSVYVIMHMPAILVGGNDKRMIAFQKTAGKFVADGIGFLRRNLAGLEGLARLIGDNLMLLRSPGVGLVLAA